MRSQNVPLFSLILRRLDPGTNSDLLRRTPQPTLTTLGCRCDVVEKQILHTPTTPKRTLSNATNATYTLNTKGLTAR